MVFEDLERRVEQALDSAGDGSYSPDDIIDTIKEAINSELDQLTDNIFIPLDDMNKYQIKYEPKDFRKKVKDTIEDYVDEIQLRDFK
jgi:hypothetical protein